MCRIETLEVTQLDRHIEILEAHTRGTAWDASDPGLKAEMRLTDHKNSDSRR